MNTACVQEIKLTVRATCSVCLRRGRPVRFRLKAEKKKSLPSEAVCKMSESLHRHVHSAIFFWSDLCIVLRPYTIVPGGKRSDLILFGGDCLKQKTKVRLCLGKERRTLNALRARVLQASRSCSRLVGCRWPCSR